jgi:ribokinase
MDVCVLGSVNLDHVCRVRRLPAPGETVTAESFERFPGGKGANQAVAAAAWGAATALIGAVGLDEAGDMLMSHLQARRVDVAAVRRLADRPSGQAQIFVSSSGENTIVVVGGANRALTPTHVEAADTTGCRVFLSQLETPLDAIEALFSARAARNGIRILNAAPALADARALLPLADIVVVNESELAFYAGVAEPAEALDGAIASARRLVSREGQTIIVTLGAAGALAVATESYVLAAGCPARVVDTTGAGDCFCGVLAAALAEGCSLAQALAVANQAAAISTEQAGASAPPTLRADALARVSPDAGEPATRSPGFRADR